SRALGGVPVSAHSSGLTPGMKRDPCVVRSAREGLADLPGVRSQARGATHHRVDIITDSKGGWSPMSSIIVRGLDEAVKRQLAAQAKEHGRSMEAEVREILTKAARRPHIGMALLSAAQDVGGVEDLPIPVRDDVARAVEFE